MNSDHVIEFHEPSADGTRVHWECSCGHGGTAPTETVEFAAERHVPADESLHYRRKVER